MAFVRGFRCFLYFSQRVHFAIKRSRGFPVLIIVTGCYIKTTLNGFHQFVVVGIQSQQAIFFLLWTVAVIQTGSGVILCSFCRNIYTSLTLCIVVT